MKRLLQPGSRLLVSARKLHPATMYGVVLGVVLVGYTILRLASASSTSLYYSPPTGAMTVGSNLVVAVRLNTDEQVKLVRASVTYPADLLQFVGADGAGSAFAVDAGAADNGSGTIYVTRYNYTDVSGDQLLTTLTFKAKTAGTATLSFGTGTYVFRSSDNSNALGSTSNGVYNLGSGYQAPPPAQPTVQTPAPAPTAAPTPSPAPNPTPTPTLSPTAPTAVVPKVNIMANGHPGTVTMSVNTPLTISWAAANNPSSCTAAGSATFNGFKAGSGSENHTVDTSTAHAITYYLSCSNSAGGDYGYVIVNVVASGTTGTTISAPPAPKTVSALTSLLNFRRATPSKPATPSKVTVPRGTTTSKTPKTAVVPRISRTLNPDPVSDPSSTDTSSQGEVQLTATNGNGGTWPAWLTILSGVASAGVIILAVRLGLTWWDRRRTYLGGSTGQGLTAEIPLSAGTVLPTATVVNPNDESRRQ